MCLETPGFLGLKISYQLPNSYRKATDKPQESYRQSYREAVESHDKATEKLQEG